MLDYLHQNFLTETEFAHRAGWTQQRLTQAVGARVMPGPSYVLTGEWRVQSFVADQVQPVDLRFYLRSYLEWAAGLDRLDLHSEEAAKAHFMTLYLAEKDQFLLSDLGREALVAVPQLLGNFDAPHRAATWGHFLNGVYGVCTRDGAPGTIFRKQVGVMMVEALADAAAETALLRRAVDYLDQAASDFAPHERGLSSRQRCVTDIRARLSPG